MSPTIIAIIILAAHIAGTLVAMALFSLVDDGETPEAMTGDDYPNASEAADR